MVQSSNQDDKPLLMLYGSSEGNGQGNGTGFGNVVAHLIPLLAANFNVIHVATDDEDVVAPRRVLTIPAAVNRRTGGDPFGRDILMKAVNTYRPDIFFGIQDIYVFSDMGASWDLIKQKIPTVIYFPTDCTPRDEWVQSLKNVTIPVVYSEYGFKEITAKMPSIKDRVKIIPHGVSTSEFFPIDKNDPSVLHFRRSHGIPDGKKVITFVGRNQRRKNLGQLLVIFRDLKKDHKDYVLYMHTKRSEAMWGHGWDLPKACESLGLKVGEDVFFPVQEFPTGAGTYDIKSMNLVYAMSDVTVSTSLGEGWGLMSTESFATKRPFICPDNSVNTELCQNGKYGLNIPIREDRIIYADNDVIRKEADPEKFKAAIVDVLENPDKYKEMVENAYERAKTEFNWTNILPVWLKVLKQALKDFKPSGIFYENI